MGSPDAYVFPAFGVVDEQTCAALGFNALFQFGGFFFTADREIHVRVADGAKAHEIGVV